MLHFCQAQCSVAESIPMVEIAPTLDQDLFRLVVAKKKKKSCSYNTTEIVCLGSIPKGR